MRQLAFFAFLLAVAGCATAPDDGLLASTAIVNSKSLEQGDVIEVGRFSQQQPGAAFADDWEPYVPQRVSPPTTYRLVQLDGAVVVEANAGGGYTGLQRLLRIDPHTHPIIEWRWRVPRLESDAEARNRPSPRARIMLAFHGDADKLDFEQRAQFRLAQAITGHRLPYAALIYVWQNGAAADSVLRSPYTERVRLIAMDSAEGNFDRWLSYRRNVLEDYRRAFGEDPGEVVGVGIYTDVDNNSAPGLAYYGDITFRRQ